MTSRTHTRDMPISPAWVVLVGVWEERGFCGEGGGKERERERVRERERERERENEKKKCHF